MALTNLLGMSLSKLSNIQLGVPVAPPAPPAPAPYVEQIGYFRVYFPPTEFRRHWSDSQP